MNATIDQMPKQTSKKQSTKQPAKSSNKPRRRPVAKHRGFRLTKKKTVVVKPLPGLKKLFRATFGLLNQHKKIFGSIVLIYAAFQFVFIKGFGSGFTIPAQITEFEEITGENAQTLGNSTQLFSDLVGSFGSGVDQSASTYQLFFTIFTVLAVIWLCRQLLAGEKPRIRDGFYKGMYPLIPFILVLIVMSLQLLPAAIGNYVFSTVITNGLAITFLERLLWFMLALGLSILSLYMIISSLFALYVVTLPDLTPIKALRSARELVIHRRIGIFARLIVMPIFILLLAAVVFIPIIMFVPILAEPLFLFFWSAGLVATVVYIYSLYRQLL